LPTGYQYSELCNTPIQLCNIYGAKYIQLYCVEKNHFQHKIIKMDKNKKDMKSGDKTTVHVIGGNAKGTMKDPKLTDPKAGADKHAPVKPDAKKPAAAPLK
jgi:hypothetical protein